LWDAATGEQNLTFIARRVSEIAWSPDSQLLVVGDSQSGLARVLNRAGQDVTGLWDTDSKWDTESPTVAAVRFSPDGRLVAVAITPAKGHDDTSGNQVNIWDWKRHAVVRTISTLADGGLAFDHSGARIATASRGGLTEIWDVGNGQKVATLKGHTGSVTDVTYSPDGSLIATGS